MENPFNPTFGQYPLVPARRTNVLQRWAEAFDPAVRSARARKTILIGDRGVGKTVLLDTAHDMAAEAGWVVTNAAGVDARALDVRLIERLWRAEPGSRASTRLGMKVGPASIERVWTPPSEAPPTGLRAAVEAVLAGRGGVRPTGVLLEVDELHDVPAAQIKRVANEFQLLERDGLLVAFVAAGLPSLDLGDEGRVPTFLTRAWQPKLGAVDDDEIARAFLATLRSIDGDCSAAALTRAVRAIGGLPYAMQLLGWHLVERCGVTFTHADVDQVLPDVHTELVSDLRLDYAVSPARRDLLAAMSDQPGKVPLSVIARRLHLTPQQLSPTRAWLINHGYITAPERGHLEFAHVGLRAIVATDPTLAAKIAGWAPARSVPSSHNAPGRELQRPDDDR